MSKSDLRRRALAAETELAKAMAERDAAMEARAVWMGAATRAQRERGEARGLLDEVCVWLVNPSSPRHILLQRIEEARA